MPFLRVIRDKRGYETTYLMHWYRENNRQRTRILYIFRTPGGVRVGRASLEPEVLREIETQHPEISFDWKVVLDSQQLVDTAPDPRRVRRRRRSGDEDAPPGPAATPVLPLTRPREEAPASGAGAAGPGRTAPPRPAIPSTIEGSTPDEQIAFLALWYPIVRSRVPQRTSDPVRREALLALAERLNAAAWTDADQIVTGLQQAAEALERLSHVFSRRRRRSRRTATRPVTRSGVEGPESTVSGVEPPVESAVEPPAASVSDPSSPDE